MADNATRNDPKHRRPPEDIRQQIRERIANPGPSTITPEQGQILGQVYQLILSWRRERLAVASGETGTQDPPAVPGRGGGLTC
jgi:hypothetical protein